MSPALISLILSLVQEAITLEPQIAAQLKELFAKENPTPADWEALRVQVLGKTYADYVPASALPAGGTANAPGAVTPPGPSNAPISQSGAKPTT
jgi:hypothetical protein